MIPPPHGAILQKCILRERGGFSVAKRNGDFAGEWAGRRGGDEVGPRVARFTEERRLSTQVNFVPAIRLG